MDFIQPILENDKGLINMQSGKMIDLANPKPEMILLEDIALNLSNICRFGGALPQHYSVAEHTLLVWQLVPEAYKPAALLHDAAEAYIGDVVKPLKHLIGERYAAIEDNFNYVIFKKYNVPFEHMRAIKQWDNQALELEHSYFRFGKQDLIQHQYEYRAKLGWYEPAKHALLGLLNHHFLQHEINFLNQ